MEALEDRTSSAPRGALENPLIGALIFGAGAAVTAGSYFLAAPGGTYLVSTGLVVGGALQFIRAMWSLLMRDPGPDEPPQWPSAVAASGVIAFAVTALLAVGATEYLGVREGEAWAAWEAAIEEHDHLQDESGPILDAFFAREDITGQDIVDAYRIAELYERAAAVLDAVDPLPTGVEPHRAKVSGLEREYAATFRFFADAVGKESEADIRKHLDRMEALETEIGRAIDAYNAWLDEQDRPKDE